MLDMSPLKQALVEKYFMFSDINLMPTKYADQNQLLRYKCLPFMYSVYQKLFNHIPLYKEMLL